MKTLVIASVTALATAPAFAGNLTPAEPEPVVTPPPAPVAVDYDWTGFYAGAQLGWGQLSAEGGGVDDEGDGVIGGVHAGYDWDFGNYVVGVGLDYNAADLEMDGGAGNMDGLGRAKLRAGYDAGDFLIYGTGGAAYGTAELAAAPAAENDIGWFAGAGVEYRVNERVSVAGEALYHQWDDFDSSGIDLDATTVQARVSYRF